MVKVDEKPRVVATDRADDFATASTSELVRELMAAAFVKPVSFQSAPGVELDSYRNDDGPRRALQVPAAAYPRGTERAGHNREMTIIIKPTGVEYSGGRATVNAYFGESDSYFNKN